MLLREALSSEDTPFAKLLRLPKDTGSSETRPVSPQVNVVNRDVYQPYRKFNPTELAELATLYEAGTSMVELGKKFECNRQTVARQLKAAGVILREQKIRTPAFNRRARALYEQGNSLEDVAEMLDVQATTINRAVRAAGGQLRQQGRRSQNG